VKPTADPRRRYAGFENVPLRVTVRVGRAICSLGRLASLEKGDVVTLDREVGAPFDLIVDGRIIAGVEPVAGDTGIGVKLVRAVKERDGSGS
jgi:flagellar motor switch protein FliN